MGLAENIKKYRKKAGLTQAQLAEKVGININTLQRYEYGEREPTTSTIFKISNILHVSVANLYDMVDSGIVIVHKTRESFEEEEKITVPFLKLNKRGREEAVHRVEELTKVPEYQRASADPDAWKDCDTQSD